MGTHRSGRAAEGRGLSRAGGRAPPAHPSCRAGSARRENPQGPVGLPRRHAWCVGSQGVAVLCLSRSPGASVDTPASGKPPVSARLPRLPLPHSGGMSPGKAAGLAARARNGLAGWRLQPGSRSAADTPGALPPDRGNRLSVPHRARHGPCRAAGPGSFPVTRRAWRRHDSGQLRCGEWHGRRRVLAGMTCSTAGGPRRSPPGTVRPPFAPRIGTWRATVPAHGSPGSAFRRAVRAVSASTRTPAAWLLRRGFGGGGCRAGAGTASSGQAKDAQP